MAETRSKRNGQTFKKGTTPSGKPYEAMRSKSKGVKSTSITTKTPTRTIVKGKTTRNGKSEKWTSQFREGTTPGGRGYSTNRYTAGGAKKTTAVYGAAGEGGYSKTTARDGSTHRTQSHPDYVNTKATKGPTTPVRK